MNWAHYAIVHVAAILLLTGTTFAVFGGAPDSRRKLILAVGGICSLLVLASGFGLAAEVRMASPADWPLWLWLKVPCWLALSAIAGIAYRRREATPRWIVITCLALLVALALVFLKPWA